MTRFEGAGRGGADARWHARSVLRLAHLLVACSFENVTSYEGGLDGPDIKFPICLDLPNGCPSIRNSRGAHASECNAGRRLAVSQG